MRTPQPTLAFVPWGDVFEDFYGSIGVSLDRYCDEFAGSWHIGLIHALRSQGIATVVYYSSTQVSRPVRRTHAPTGATIVLTPAPRTYRAIHGRMVHPHHSFGYGSGVDSLFGPSTGWRRSWFSALQDVAPYLAIRPRTLRREIRRDGCSAILCQDYEHAGFDKSIALGMLTRLPVFAIFQGGTGDWNRLGRRLRPRTIRRCAGFLVGPAAEAQRLRAQYGVGPDRLHQVLNALADSIWGPVDRAAARRRFGLPADALVVVWHGRVEMQYKGLDLLMDAWEQLCRARPDRNLHLALLGDGQDSPALRQRIAALPAPNVTWIDRFVSDRELIRSFLAAGDVYAFPSRVEGQPNAPVEALATGLPLVAADASGVREILKDGEASGGIVVPVGDAPALAGALGRVLDDEDLRRTLAERGRERAKAFSSEAIGRQLRAVLFPHLNEARQ